MLDAVHAKAFDLLRAGKVTGLRIDHVDGLMDPVRYLQNLQQAVDGDGERDDDASADTDALAGDRRSAPRTYVVVEKILTGDEALPADWPVHGTTGYDFLNVLNGLFVDPVGARAIERLYQRLREDRGEFDDLLYLAKRLILRTAMSSELYVLARRLDRISEQHRWSRDFTQQQPALRAGRGDRLFPCLPHVRAGDVHRGEPRRSPARLRALMRDAKRRNRSTSASVFDFIADLLLLRDPDGISESRTRRTARVRPALQQLTGPVMAKGLEDTVFYRYYPLASLNEVGGRPDRRRRRAAIASTPGTPAAWPRGRTGFNATATHDTKRGEDMRARLDVLSEIPREWQRVVRHWQRLNRQPQVDGRRRPASPRSTRSTSSTRR